VLCREVQAQGGRSGDLDFLVHFGEWFNVKLSRILDTLRAENGLILNLLEKMV